MSRRLFGRLLPLGAGIVVWEVAARLIASPLLPPCSRVIGTLATLVQQGVIVENLLASLVALGAGLGLALIVGLPVGAAMGASRDVERALGPYVDAGLAIPTLLYVPVLFVVTGTSRAGEVYTIFLSSVFAIASYVVTGMRGVDARLVEMARAFGATRVQVFRQITWPAARPMLIAGLRVAVALAMKGMVNSEMLIASTGLGALVRTYGGRFDAAAVLALLIVILVLALAATASLHAAERRAAARAALR